MGAACAASSVEGLPLTRFYPFEEIPNIRRGSHLTFDPHGRVAAVQEGAYVVLNDSNWRELTNKYDERIEVDRVTVDHDGTTYFGALSSWGTLTPMPSGELRPSSLVPAQFPKWVMSNRIEDILCEEEGVYFVGWNGIAFWNRTTRLHQFYELPAIANVFAFEGKIHVSAHGRPVMILNPVDGSLVEANRLVFGSTTVTRSATAGPSGIVLGTSDRRLLLYRAGELKPLPGPLGAELPGPISALAALPEGDVAVSVTNGGVYIVNAEGRVKLALTGAPYSRVSDLASNERGVLWAATESGIIKILHGQPFTTFGQTLGLTVTWPQVVSWNGRILISSSGWLYEPTDSTPGAPTPFQLVPGQPPEGKWGIATVGSSLLVATGVALYAREPGSEFKTAVPNLGGARLVAIDDTTCIVIDADHIAAVRKQDGVWAECAPRISGFGYPSIVHAARNSAWIELGMNRAARIRLRDGRLEARLFESFPWAQPRWVHVSVLDSTVVLASVENKRLFFDEESESIVDDSEMSGLFEQTPYPIVRIRRDDSGTIWGSYQHGILTLTRGPDGYAVDSVSYSALNERVPLVQALPDGDIWVSSGQSLYHVDRTRKGSMTPDFRPVLIAVRDSRTHAMIPRGGPAQDSLRPLAYRENSITFDFFSGSYASLREPAYEYRLNNGSWTKVLLGSSVGLSDLGEGDYQLHVRLADARGPIGNPGAFAFTIAPPWYRTWWAFVAYPLLTCAAMVGLVHFFVRRAERRNAALEKVVADRTSELHLTMQKLQQETRISATLAERNRLAGEIHDSLEQGFTGLKLQLETTADFATCPPEVKSGLAVALNMVTFSWNEVRHAVRDLHSPILNSADLESALKQIISRVVPTPGYATLERQGTPRQLGSSVEHHLLRIAQEAIANAVKHAAATQLQVVLVFRETEVQLDIHDNGRGFDPDAILHGDIGHFGLPSFRGRASKMGGAVVITSRPGGGTRISVRVPIDNSVPL
jgi:signal transduction histidine kinase